MSGLPYQPTPKASYHKTPQSSQPARNPPLTSTSNQQPSDSYQDIQPATSSSTYQKSGGTYQKLAQTAQPTRQGSAGLSASEVAASKNRLQSAARTQELSRTVPGSAGEAQKPARKHKRRHGKGKSQKDGKDRCFIL